MSDNQEPAAEAQAPKPKKPRSERAIVRTALFIYIVVNVAYGLPMLLWPELIWDTLGGADTAALEVLSTTRWAGGVLVGLAVGAFFAFTRPAGQWTLMMGIAMQTTLAAVGIWLSLLAGEWTPTIDLWFVWVAAVVVPAESLYLWYARIKGRDLLAL